MEECEFPASLAEDWHCQGDEQPFASESFPSLATDFRALSSPIFGRLVASAKASEDLAMRVAELGARVLKGLISAEKTGDLELKKAFFLVLVGVKFACDPGNKPRTVDRKRPIFAADVSESLYKFSSILGQFSLTLRRHFLIVLFELCKSGGPGCGVQSFINALSGCESLWGDFRSLLISHLQTSEERPILGRVLALLSAAPFTRRLADSCLRAIVSRGLAGTDAEFARNSRPILLEFAARAPAEFAGKLPIWATLRGSENYQLRNAVCEAMAELLSSGAMEPRPQVLAIIEERIHDKTAFARGAVFPCLSKVLGACLMREVEARWLGLAVDRLRDSSAFVRRKALVFCQEVALRMKAGAEGMGGDLNKDGECEIDRDGEPLPGSGSSEGAPLGFSEHMIDSSDAANSPLAGVRAAMSRALPRLRPLLFSTAQGDVIDSLRLVHALETVRFAPRFSLLRLAVSLVWARERPIKSELLRVFHAHLIGDLPPEAVISGLAEFYAESDAGEKLSVDEILRQLLAAQEEEPRLQPGIRGELWEFIVKNAFLKKEKSEKIEKGGSAKAKRGSRDRSGGRGKSKRSSSHRIQPEGQEEEGEEEPKRRQKHLIEQEGSKPKSDQRNRIQPEDEEESPEKTKKRQKSRIQAEGEEASPEKRGNSSKKGIESEILEASPADESKCESPSPVVFAVRMLRICTESAPKWLVSKSASLVEIFRRVNENDSLDLALMSEFAELLSSAELELEVLDMCTKLLVFYLVKLQGCVDAHYLNFAQKAIFLVFSYRNNPEIVCDFILKRMSRVCAAGHIGLNGPAVAEVFEDPENLNLPFSQVSENELHNYGSQGLGTPGSQVSDPQVSSSAQSVLHLIFVAGQVAVKFLFLAEKLEAQITSSLARNGEDGQLETAFGSTELEIEEARTALQKLVRDSLVEENSLKAVVPLLVEIASIALEAPRRARDPLVNAAFDCLAKFMLLSEEFCLRHLNLLLSALQKEDFDPGLQTNLVIALGDLFHKHPNRISPYLQVLSKGLRSGSEQIRLTALTVLSHLILNDFFKPKGELADLSRLLCDLSPAVSQKAALFFGELASKDQDHLVMLLPELASGLASDDAELEVGGLNTIRILFDMIDDRKLAGPVLESFIKKTGSKETSKEVRMLLNCLHFIPATDHSLTLMLDNPIGLKQAITSDKRSAEILTGLLGKWRKAPKLNKLLLDQLEKLLNENSAEVFDNLKRNRPEKPKGRGRPKRI